MNPFAFPKPGRAATVSARDGADQVDLFAATMAMAREKGVDGVTLELVAQTSGQSLKIVRRRFRDPLELVMDAAISTAQACVLGVGESSTAEDVAAHQLSLLMHFQRNRRAYSDLFSGPLASRVHERMGTVVGPLDEALMRLYVPADFDPAEIAEVRGFVAERIRRMITAWITEPGPDDSPAAVHANLRRFVDRLVETRRNR